MDHEIKLEKTTAELFDSYEFNYNKDCKCYQVTGFPKSELAEFVVARDFKYKTKWIMYEKSTGLCLRITSSKTRKEAIQKGIDWINEITDEKLPELIKKKLAHYAKYRSK